MKKILSIMLTLCFFVNVSFAAFDPYADDEVEKKSYKKLYYGIVLTLLGGFLVYDGFSKEEVDVSKPKVDCTTVLHSEWVQLGGLGFSYQLRSGISLNNVSGSQPSPDTEVDYNKYLIEDKTYNVERNVLYNNGNVDLYNLTIEVRYKFGDGTYIGDDKGTHVTSEGYHIAQTKSDQGSEKEPVDNKTYEGLSLKKGASLTWQDIWAYTSTLSDMPNGSQRKPYVKEKDKDPDPGTTGLNLGQKGISLMDIRVKLNKNQQYKPIYEKRHKSDIEGVAGILLGITGIYFIVDHFLDMHKFNAYAKRHHLNLKVATASNEYKLMLQKRL